MSVPGIVFVFNEVNICWTTKNPLRAIECTWINESKQAELHTDEPILHECAVFEVHIDIEKLKRYHV
jgi:hypothetical protein